jgi:Ca2+-binding EF-hand superfamily protein
MRTILTASIVLVIAATASAQFGKNPGKRLPDVPPADAQNKTAEQEPAPEAGEGAAAAPNAIFAAIDADGDGIISKVELRKAIVALKKLDADNDGAITLAEAGGGTVGPAPGGFNDPLQAEIDRMMANDRNKDGKLTENEVPREMMPMLQGADANNDKAIDRRELAAAMQNGPNQFRGGPGGQLGPIGGADPMTGRFLKQYDRDGDGKLSLQEVPQGMQRSFQPQDDLDRDGHISAGELQAVMARMGGGARAWAAGLDPNRNQRVPPRGKP